MPKYNISDIDVFYSIDTPSYAVSHIDAFLDQKTNGLLSFNDLQFEEIQFPEHFDSADKLSEFLLLRTTSIMFLGLKYTQLTSEIFVAEYRKDIEFDCIGFKHVLFISSENLPYKKVSSIKYNGMHCYVYYRLPLISSSFLDLNRFRSYIQRKFIHQDVNLFKEVALHQEKNEINIALFCCSDIRNASYFKYKRGGKLPLKNVIGTMPFYPALLRLGYNFSRHHARPSFEYKGYTDFAMDNSSMRKFNFSYINMRTFECLVYPEKQVVNSFVDQFDEQFQWLGVFTDQSNCGIQSAFTSATFDIKSISYFLNASLNLSLTALHLERFKYLKSSIKALKFKLPWMQSTAYTVDKSNDYDNDIKRVKFYDYSGHIFNFLVKTDLLITDILLHEQCITANFNGYHNTKSNYFLIDVRKLITGSKFKNFESRKPNEEVEPLWHTKEEYLNPLWHYRIIRPDFSTAERDPNYLKEFEDLINSLRDDGRESITVSHDVNFLREHPELIADLEQVNQ